MKPLGIDRPTRQSRIGKAEGNGARQAESLFSREADFGEDGETAGEIELSVVIPVFNERASLPHLYARLTEELQALGITYELLFVDDGSKDGSSEVTKSLCQQDARAKLICFRRNFGQTAAFSAGFDVAQGRTIVTIDADLQNDPKDIGKLLAKMEEGYDVVSGWRVNRQDAFLKRKLPSMIANRLISIITGVRLHDYGCSLKAYRAEVVKNIRLYGEMHRFIPAVASWMGVSVAEVPVEHHPRRYGSSKYGLSRTVRVLLDLITIKFLQSYLTKPIQVFGLLGMISFVAGLGLAAELSVERLLFGQALADRPILLLAALLIIMGVQLVTMGLLGELIIRTYYEAQDKPTYVVKEVFQSGPERVKKGTPTK